MSNEVKHSLIWATAAAAIVCSLIWSIAWHSVATKRAAMEAGLIQKPFTVQQDTGAYWTKPDAPSK